MVYGEDPGEKRIDHINGKKWDNRIENLRLATCAENNRNQKRRRNNRSGYKGVYYGGRAWKARIVFDGKTIQLGRYKTRQEAHAAYCKAATELHGEFACPG
jgi:hypothetical protein